MELERKWRLLDGMPTLLDYYPRRLTQGYLSLDPEIRLRTDGGVNHFTIKGDGGIARPEREFGISRDTYIELWQQRDPSGQAISKDRGVPFAAPTGFRWLLDEFQDQLEGLILVELEPIETNTSDEDVELVTAALKAVQLDPRFGRAIEVTDDKRYKNKRLAVHGIPPLEDAT